MSVSAVNVVYTGMADNGEERMFSFGCGNPTPCVGTGTCSNRAITVDGSGTHVTVTCTTCSLQQWVYVDYL